MGGGFCGEADTPAASKGGGVTTRPTVFSLYLIITQQSLSILLTTIDSPKGVTTNKSKSMLLIDIPKKPAKDTETKECVEPGSIKALANKV